MGKEKLSDEQLEELRSIYPKRPGNLWTKVRKQLDRHLAKGADYDEILVGTMRYAKYISNESIRRRDWQRSFIKLCQTFYGPDQHWLAEYDALDAAEVICNESAAERIRRTNEAAFGDAALDMGIDYSLDIGNK